MNNFQYSNREAWIDNVKMVAMLFVILGHTPVMIHSSLPSWLAIFVLSFHMPLFVVMTGYTSVRSIDAISDISSLGAYLLKITKRILVPCAFFSAIMGIVMSSFKFASGGELPLQKILVDIGIVIAYVIAWYYRNISLKYGFYILCLVSIPLSFSSPFWFFNMIWSVCVCCALSSYITKAFNVRISEWGGQFLFALLAFVIALLVENISSKTSDFILFFIAGYLMKKYHYPVKNFKIVYSFLYLIAGLIIAVLLGRGLMDFWKMHFIQFTEQRIAHLYFLRVAASILICLFFIHITKFFSEDYSRFSFWGAQTLGLYMVHSMLVNMVERLKLSFDFDDVFFLLYSITAVTLIIIFSMLIIKFFMKYKVTNELCLGNLK